MLFITNWRWTPAVIIGLGVTFRLLWLWLQPERAPDYGEAGNIAYAIFSRGEFAAAFRKGQGATAHMMPITPMIAGGMFRLLGFNTAAANLTLSLWALGLMSAAFWLQFRTFEMLGLRRIYALAALTFLCLVPLNFSREVIWFRVWEGALAVAIASLALYLIVKWDENPVSRAKICSMGALLGFLFFIQPPLGLGCVAAATIFAFRNLTLHQFALSVCACLLSTMIFMVPWAVRNSAALGEPILLRSNFGLELALAFHERALSADSGTAYRQRTLDIHPYSASGPGYGRMLAVGGEVAYFNQLKRETITWIADHPATTLRLLARHGRDMLFPAAWQLEGTSHATGKMLLHWLISAGAIVGFAAWIGTDRRWLYPAATVTVTILPYLLVQPTIRYRYLIFSLLVFAGWAFAQRVGITVFQGKSQRQVAIHP